MANSLGRLTQIDNGVSTDNILGYDPLGRITGSSQTTNGATYTFPAYKYNLAGSLISETLPSGRVIAISYDAANRPVTLQGSLNGATNYIGNPSGTDTTNPATWIQYWPSGSPLSFTRGNGLTYAAEYNGRLQQIESFEAMNYPSLTAANAPSNILFASCPQWGYGSVAVIVQACPASPTTGDNGNLWGYSEYLGGPGNNAFATFAQSGITYDGVNRLVGIADSTGSSTNWSRQFGYDAYGNMNVTGNSGTTLNPDMPGPAATYNTKNQRSDATYSYDSAGNLQSIQVGQVALTYDAENRQIGAGSAAYSYDGNGRRVVKNTGGIITAYVYDSAGELTAEYTSVPPSSAPPCTTCYLSYDHLGSVRLITDKSGHLVSRHDYLPFGEEIMQGQAGRTSALSFQSSDDVTQRFTGKERDSESGLDYFGARYYGSALGRFTSPDPIFFQSEMLAYPQRFNLYAYVRNSPLTLSDPSGEKIQLSNLAGDRQDQINAICASVGNDNCNNYLSFDRDKEDGQYYVNIKDGAAADFANTGDVAAALEGIINDKQLAFVNLEDFDSSFKGPDGKDTDLRHIASGGALGATVQEKDGIHIHILRGGSPEYTSVPFWQMVWGPSDGYNDQNTVLAHETGHAVYMMKTPKAQQNKRDNNNSALKLENAARKAKDPQADTRWFHF